MNPAVSLVAASRGELRWTRSRRVHRGTATFGILGAWAANLMFDLPTCNCRSKLARGLVSGPARPSPRSASY